MEKGHHKHEANESIGEEFAEHHGTPVSVVHPTAATRRFIRCGIIHKK
jgi:hypothetical protein